MKRPYYTERAKNEIIWLIEELVKDLIELADTHEIDRDVVINEASFILGTITEIASFKNFKFTEE